MDRYCIFLEEPKFNRCVELASCSINFFYFWIEFNFRHILFDTYNESVEKVLIDPNRLNSGGLLPLRWSEIAQYSAFYASDFFILITTILSSDLFYRFNTVLTGVARRSATSGASICWHL